MKRYGIKSVGLLWFMAVMMAGCVTKEDPGEKTRNGKNVYDSWNEAMNEIIADHVNIAFLFNTWFMAFEHQKDSIEDLYLPDYKIREAATGNGDWELYKGSDRVYLIKTNGDPLSSTGSHWEIETSLESGRDYPYHSYDYYYPVSFEDGKSMISITCTEASKWEIGITVPRKPWVVFNIAIRAMQNEMPSGLRSTDFSLTGKGELTFAKQKHYHENQEIAYIDFEIADELLYLSPTHRSIFPGWYWQGGKVVLKAYSGQKQTDVIAAFRESVRHHMRVFITYRGVTEEWQETVNDY